MGIDLAEKNEQESSMNTIDIKYLHEDVIRIEIEGENAIAWFKILVNRAMNVWDGAPHELKAFADILIHGNALQNYAKQDSRNSIINPPNTENR